MMIGTLIRKEILDQMMSIRFSVSLILALLFLTSSTYMLATDYGWLQGERGPFKTLSTMGSWYTIYRDIPPLRVLATGLDQNLSLDSSNTAFTLPQFPPIQFAHNPLRYLVSQLDFVFFINIVGSLLAFVFTYDAISGERQQGTLRLTMAQPISRPLFLASKFLGSYTSLVLSLMPALIAVVIVLHLHPNVDFRREDWGTVIFLFLLALLYLCVFSLLGLFVSCVTQTPKTTLVALMTLWTILVLVIPNFSPFLAVRLRPVRSLYEVVEQMSALKQPLTQQVEKRIRDLKQGRDWEALSQSEKEAINRVWNEYARQQMNLSAGEIAKIREGFINELEAQAKLSQYLGLISPSSALIYLASDIAQTGIESERHFRRAAMRYYRQYVEYVNSHIERTGDYRKLWYIDENDALPFTYRELNTSQAVVAHFPHFVVLALYCVLCFFGAQIVFIRSQL